MTTLTINLPNNVVQEAKSAGLLTPEALTQLLKDAMRRQAGRRLLATAKQLHAAGIPPMRDGEVVAEIKAVRNKRKAGHAGRP